jgi:hypothetical protein
MFCKKSDRKHQQSLVEWSIHAAYAEINFDLKQIYLRNFRLPTSDPQDIEYKY